MKYKNRHIVEEVLYSLKYSPVVIIIGARQVGKSTLVEDAIQQKIQARYITFDNFSILAAAQASPSSYIESLELPIIIDEIQREPAVLLAIKQVVDQNRKPGLFILTGSANVLTLPKAAESLAGRVEIYTMWPLSQGEITGKKEQFIDIIFSDQKITSLSNNLDKSDLITILVNGGYPEILNRSSIKSRNNWFSSYITTILQRDVRDLANLEGLTLLPNLLAILANRAGNLLSFSEISRITTIKATTLKRYMALLENVFLILKIPSWGKNLDKRIVKAPKIFLNDTGLLCYLRNINENNFENDHMLIGAVLENFVLMELLKQIGWSELKPSVYHYRTQTGQEIDIILEAPDGRVCVIEVKMKSQIDARDIAIIKSFSEENSNIFHRGIIFYTGNEVINFSKTIVALPINSLWDLGHTIQS
jgi:predicted AAA+ superfamily ATPase